MQGSKSLPGGGLRRIAADSPVADPRAVGWAGIKAAIRLRVRIGWRFSRLEVVKSGPSGGSAQAVVGAGPRRRGTTTAPPDGVVPGEGTDPPNRGGL